MSYHITGGDPLGQFAIEHLQNEWKVSVRKPLDREVTDNYLLNITASDGIFTAKAVVEVKVLDANDNNPVCEKVKSDFPLLLLVTSCCRRELLSRFNIPCLFPLCVLQSIYSESVPEDSPAGRLILQASATDADIRSNAQISYELQGAGSEYFIIDSDTGVYPCSDKYQRRRRKRMNVSYLFFTVCHITTKKCY